MGAIEMSIRIGHCEYCGEAIHSDEEHYELPDGTMYCSSECLLADMDIYHVWGEAD